MINYTNGLLHASGDLSEYTVTKTDDFGVAHSETYAVSQTEVHAESYQPEEIVSSEPIVSFSAPIGE